MTMRCLTVVAVCAIGLTALTGPVHSAESAHELFNGKDLDGWDGNMGHWSVEDGAIVGRTTADRPIEENTFLIWKGKAPRDFRLTLEYRIEGGNSGVQYRSKVVDPKKWIVGGYQADIDSGTQYTGIMYEERGRGILATRGQRVQIDPTGKKTAEQLAEPAELQKAIHADDWNTYVIEVVGSRMRHSINDKLMSDTDDRDAEKRSVDGVIALQLHRGDPMTVRFRNLRLDAVDGPERAQPGQGADNP